MAEQRKRPPGRGKDTAKKRRSARWNDRAGYELGEWRKKHSPPLTQQDFAIVLGCSRTTISRMENGHRTITGEDLDRLADEYHTRMEDLIGKPWSGPWRRPPRATRRRARGRRRSG